MSNTPSGTSHGIILHNYQISPFSEKVRLVLGYKKLAWQSVTVPSIMPKPDVVALTGGYRKTPFMQIGSDVYCDSALICEVLEELQPSPSLYPTAQAGVARVLAQWADTTLFWAAMAYNLQPKGAAALFGAAPPEAAKAFAMDRAAMTAGQNRVRPTEAATAYKTYLRQIAAMLQGQDYLLGVSPTIADFSVYHSLWFTRHCVSAVADVLDATPVVLDWMDRMAAIGHGQKEKTSATDSIAVCARSTGAAAQNDTEFVDEHGIPLGSRVTITAEIFGPEVTEGELVAATRSRYTLRRTDERAGVVHVHFPRVGYVLRKAE